MHPLTFLLVHERSSFAMLAVSLRRSVCSSIHSLDKNKHTNKKTLKSCSSFVPQRVKPLVSHYAPFSEQVLKQLLSWLITVGAN